MFEPMPELVIYCYGAYQPLFNTMKDVIFEEGIPPYLNQTHNALIIVDDLMSELGNDSRLANLFTKGSHHRNLSIVFIVQNLFHKGSQMRNIHLNSHYLVLFKNPRDKTQITHLGRQMFPGKNKSIQEIFEDATSPAYGYLFLDFHPMTEDYLRMRTGIFPGDEPFVYQTK
ncbi:hypothetical protein RF55_19908 [Lasius niger]|uniref:Uncharacterized protein n=1 Tax=Lasius niger TaxID=67767 RepID=A0A0J7JZ79_LASNI|nr:hypothetical protein RF55_19908 [Lasius niger]